MPEPKKEWDHLMDAMRYAMTDERVGTTVVVSQEEKIMDEKARLERYIARRQGRI